MRTTLPSFDGLRPRSDARIADSMALSCDGSNGCATIMVGSGTDRLATWLIGILEPYASTWTGSRIVVVARPVRTPASSWRTWSVAAVIRFVHSAYNPFRSFTSIVVSPLGSHQGPDRLADDRALDVARRAEVEHDDRKPVVHAERDGGRVHHLQSLLQHFQI